MNVSYQVWYTNSPNLVWDGDDYEEALDFIRRQVAGLDAAEAAKEIAIFSLMRFRSPEDCEVVATGAQLLALLG